MFAAAFWVSKLNIQLLYTQIALHTYVDLSGH